MKVANACCEPESSISRVEARGVALLLAAEYAATMVDNENVVTASMLDARMPRMLPTAEAPILVARPSGIRPLATVPISAVATASTPYSAERNHSRRVMRSTSILNLTFMSNIPDSSAIVSVPGSTGCVRGPEPGAGGWAPPRCVASGRRRLLIQPALGIERCHAAEARRGHRLAVNVIGHVTGGEHAGYRGHRGHAARPHLILM